MPYNSVSYTYEPTQDGGYDVDGQYYTQSNADVSGGVVLEDQFFVFDATQIQQTIDRSISAGGVTSVTLSFKLSNGDIFQNQQVTATDEYFTSLGYQNLVEADTTNVSGPTGGGPAYAYVYSDIDSQAGAVVGATQENGVKDQTLTSSYDVTDDINNAASAGRDLIVDFSVPRADTGLTHVSDVTITVNALVRTGFPTISGTVADQAVADNQTINPFSTVVLGDPDNPTGAGDDVSITILDANGNSTGSEGMLTLPGASQTGIGITNNDGQGDYELGPETSLATLQSELRALVFTPSTSASTPALVTFEMVLQSAQGDTDNDQTSAIVGPPCYCRGTLISTERGEVAVEDLAIGDGVVTRSGAVRPIKWLGRRSYTGRFLAANPNVQPIRFNAGSLGDGLPRRSLLVSPEHAMFLDGVLVPARHLVNGVTIARAPGLDSVSYYHVELDSHDVILAEGAPSETFLDDGSRGMFQNAAEYSAAQCEMLAPGVFCAPRIDSGYRLERIRLRLEYVDGGMGLAA